MSSQIIGIAEALNYLHHYSPPVIHGDVKPVSFMLLARECPDRQLSQSNVLVSAEGKALLCDFGKVRFSYRQQRARSHPSPGGTRDYLAPEIIKACNNVRTTEASDIYSFGMLIYTVGSRSSAFPTEQSGTVIAKVARGERPEIPNTGLFADCKGDGISDLVEEMWADEPSRRPNIRDVLNRLGTIRSKSLCSM